MGCLRQRGIQYRVSAIDRYPIFCVRYREVSGMGCQRQTGIRYGVSSIEGYPVWGVRYKEVSSMWCLQYSVSAIGI